MKLIVNPNYSTELPSEENRNWPSVLCDMIQVVENYLYTLKCKDSTCENEVISLLLKNLALLQVFLGIEPVWYVSGIRYRI